MIYSNLNEVRGAYSAMFEVAKYFAAGTRNHYFDNIKMDIRMAQKREDGFIRGLYEDGEKVVVLIKLAPSIGDKYTEGEAVQAFTNLYRHPGIECLNTFKREGHWYAYYVFHLPF